MPNILLQKNFKKSTTNSEKDTPVFKGYLFLFIGMEIPNYSIFNKLQFKSTLRFTLFKVFS